jgi:hypothetical protein
MLLLSELEKRVKIIREGFMADRIGDLAIGGDRVMDILGISTGPDVGRILNILLESVTDHPALNTEQGLTDLLKLIRGKREARSQRSPNN